MDVMIVIAVVLVLITLNGIFVAAEIGTIGARRARVSQAASEGDRMAQLLLPVLEDPHLLDNYIAACLGDDTPTIAIKSRQIAWVNTASAQILAVAQ